MRRLSRQLRFVLLWIGIGLSAEVARAAEPNATVGRLPPPEAMDRNNGASEGEPVTPANSVPGACSCDCPGYWVPNPDFAFPEIPGNWVGGVEYLLLRPHQLSDEAFEISPSGGSGASVQTVNFAAPYNSGVRTFLGWQSNCNHAWRFSYTYDFDDTRRSSAVPEGGVILTPLGAQLDPGDTLTATQHLRLNLWDVESIQRLQMPLCDGNGGPTWEISWSWGVRIIDVEESIRNEVMGPNAEVLTQQSTFAGAGPRIGFETRRQLGCRRLSALLGADAALLLGGQNVVGTNTASGLNSAQIVPNFDLRIGICWQPGPGVSMNLGWMFEMFNDATKVNNTSAQALVSPPTANSLYYDGLFVRTELDF